MKLVAFVLVLAVGLPPAWALERLAPETETQVPPPLFVGSNGFAISVAEHDGHRDITGRSLAGELLTFHAVAGGQVFEHRFGEVAVRTWLGADGRPVWDELETREGTIGRPSLDAQMREEAAIAIESGDAPEWDLAVYEGLGAALLSAAPAPFWEEFHAAAEEWAAGLESAAAGDSCLGICTACAASLVLALTSYWWVAITCAGTGPIAVACILTLIGTTAGKIVMGIQCALCLSCAKKKSESPEEDESGDGIHAPVMG